MSRLRPFAFIAAAIAVVAASAAPLTLVDTGTPKAVIVCAADADRPAADEFADVIKRITGAELPIVATAPAQGPRALIGGAADEFFTASAMDSLPYGGYRIRCNGDVLAIAGRTGAGTMHGVCGFLQDYLGVRWFMPSELFEVLPETSSITIAECDDVHEPTFDCRLFSGLDGAAQGAWSRHMRLSPNSFEVPYRAGFRHWLYAIYPPSKYAQSDPDIYPMLNGERVKPTTDAQPGWQPCTGNPRTVEIGIQHIREYFDAHPNTHSYSVSINDNNRWCECDMCTALDVPHVFRGRTCYSDRYYTFVNAIARGVAQTHPDKFIGCFAYAGVEPPPKTIEKLEPNVFVNITQDTAQYFDLDYRETDYGFWRQWQAKCSHMGKYDYSGLGALAPRYYPHILAEDLRHSHQIGLVAMHTEAYPYWSNYGPMIYLQARMMWDVSLNEDELLDEFFQKLYGPAAGEMQAFYDELEAAWMTPREGKWFAGISSARQQCEIYTIGGLASLQRHLREAARLAPEGIISDRVAYIRKCFEYPALFIRGWLVAEHLLAATDPDVIARDVDALIRVTDGRDAAFARSVLEDDLSTSWYDTHAGRAGVQAEWRSMIQTALLSGVRSLAGGGAANLDSLISELSARDAGSPLVLGLRAQRGDFDSLPNLLQNPGFEETGTGENPAGPEWEAKDAPPGWSVWRIAPGTGRFWRDQNLVHSGKLSAAMTGGDCMCYIARAPVTPGKNYVGWAHIYVTGATPPRKTTLDLRWSDANGAWHAGGQNVSTEVRTVGEWSRVTVAAEAPEGAASAVVLIVVDKQREGETTWCDDIFLAEVGE